MGKPSARGCSCAIFISRGIAAVPANLVRPSPRTAGIRSASPKRGALCPRRCSETKAARSGRMALAVSPACPLRLRMAMPQLPRVVPPCDLVTKSVAADRVEDAPRDGVLASATEMMGLCDDAFTGLAFLYALDILCTKRGRPTVVQTTRALRPNDSWPRGRRPRYRPSVT